MTLATSASSNDESYRAHVWRGLTYLAGAVLCVLTLRWHVLDQAPTGWDDSAYLLQAIRLYQSWRLEGWSSFWHEFFFYDRGRVGLITVMAQPFFFLFGPTVDAAMVPFALAWLAVAWAISGIARTAGTTFFGLDERQATAGGFFALLLFAVFPMTGFLTQLYLVDFPLAVFALLTLNAAFAYRCAPRTGGLVAMGFFAGCGMMTKVTFPVFALPAILIHGRTLLEIRRYGSPVRALAVPLAVAALICGPYYAVNIVGLVRITGLLSSSALAQTFGFADALDMGEVARFMWGFFVQYEYGLSAIATAIVCAMLLRQPRPPQAGWGLAVFAVWFLVPTALVAFSPIKQDRYFYGAMPALAIMGGFGLAMLTRVRLGAIILLALFLCPFGRLALSHGVSLPPAVLPYLTTMVRAPDPSDHGVKSVVAQVAQTLGAQPEAPKTVTFLSGASQFCNASLFSLTAMQHRIGLVFKYLPAFENPGMTAEQAVSFLRSRPHDAILYKMGTSFLKSFAALDKAIVPLLEASMAYERRDLAFAEPDSCSLALFVRKTTVP